MVEPIIKNYDKRLYKKCIKCRQWQLREHKVDEETGEVLEKKGFGSHNSSDGLQSICFGCKNTANNDARNRNVNTRIRHHTATRCKTQLGDLLPSGFTKDIEDYLGYKILHLVRHLRERLREREGPDRSLRKALNEGYHIDHVVPLHTFQVIVADEDKLLAQKVDWEEFRRCWAITNLEAIPAQENLQKGGTVAEAEAKQIGDVLEDTVDHPDEDSNAG